MGTPQWDSEVASPQFKKDKLARKLWHWFCRPHEDLSAFTESQTTSLRKPKSHRKGLKLELQVIICRNAQVYLEANIHLPKLFGSFGTQDAKSLWGTKHKCFRQLYPKSQFLPHLKSRDEGEGHTGRLEKLWILTTFLDEQWYHHIDWWFLVPEVFAGRFSAFSGTLWILCVLF